MTADPSVRTSREPTDPVLRRTLAAAGLASTGAFTPRAGWVSRAWIGEDVVVRVAAGQACGAYEHEARVVDLLAGSAVPHARRVAQGEGPDGPWSISERLPGQTLHEVWPGADVATRSSIIESLGAALRALHRVDVPPDLLPPWMAQALAGGPWPAFHPPVRGAVRYHLDVARSRPGADLALLDAVTSWVREREPLVSEDPPVLVHGDLHGSNIMVEGGRVTGLIDLAEAVAQPADVELDTILRWCTRAREYPPTQDARGLDPSTLSEVPDWLRRAYPELFARPRLRERLRLYDMHRELALYAHHRAAQDRAAARGRIVRLLEGSNHLDTMIL